MKIRCSATVSWLILLQLCSWKSHENRRLLSKVSSFHGWSTSINSRWRRLQRWVVPIRSMVPITCHQYLGLVCSCLFGREFKLLVWMTGNMWCQRCSALETWFREIFEWVLCYSLGLPFWDFILLGQYLVRFVFAFRVTTRRGSWQCLYVSVPLRFVLHCSWMMFPDLFSGAVLVWGLPKNLFRAACQHAFCIYSPASCLAQLVNIILSMSCAGSSLSCTARQRFILSASTVTQQPAACQDHFVIYCCQAACGASPVPTPTPMSWTTLINLHVSMSPCLGMVKFAPILVVGFEAKFLGSALP